MKLTQSDMALRALLCPYSAPENIPVRFSLDGQAVQGIPKALQPRVEVRKAGNRTLTSVTCEVAKGLIFTAECTEYEDYPAVEWFSSLENKGSEDCPLVSDWAVAPFIPGEGVTLEHGNFDPWHTTGYAVTYTPLKEEMHIWPHVDRETYGETPYQQGGTPCCGASPYMRLLYEGCGINLAIGWPGQWEAFFMPVEGGLSLRVKQQRCRMVIRPGEKMVSPRVLLQAFDGDGQRGMNLWRRFYFDHILPKPGGKPIQPCVLQVTSKPFGEENTTATQESLLADLESCLDSGIRPDVFWVDAGWYPCRVKNWGAVGSWYADPIRFPRGLKPISDRMAELGGRLLVWFEPERVAPDTQIAREHPHWVLMPEKYEGPIVNSGILNMGDPEVCAGITDIVHKALADNGVSVYRQDFNCDPLPIWVQYEEADREGAVENLYNQGYLRFWDELAARNPGLLIDSCCGGGRRNELEAMRRSVPLHHTDVGYDPVLMQHQHAEMFRWIPCYGSGATSGAGLPPLDRYEQHCRLSPYFKVAAACYSAQELTDTHVMLNLWRRTLPYMMDGDFYVLADSLGRADRWFAISFDDGTGERGFFQTIRNEGCLESNFTVKLTAVDKESRYRLENGETGEVRVCTGAQLMQGFTVEQPKRSGAVWFYEKV